jgi:hypothetical protein
MYAISTVLRRAFGPGLAVLVTQLIIGLTGFFILGVRWRHVHRLQLESLQEREMARSVFK